MSGPEGLLVFEYSGTPRSGKGSIVADISKRESGIATEETGADYRALTKALLIDRSIDPEMPSDRVIEVVESFDNESLSSFVAERKTLVETFGSDCLYETDVTTLVSVISPVEAVRKAVKAGFLKRVEKVIDDGDTEILLVDGRNLAPIVEGIANTRLVMRTFVSCFPIEAARREAARLGHGTETLSDVESLFRIKADIEKRTREDHDRVLDPVRHDTDAIDYWFDSEVFNATLERYRNMHDISEAFQAIVRLVNSRYGEYYNYPRHGAGTLAADSGRQVHFDTTHFYVNDDPKGSMLDAAHTMYTEALDRIGYNG